jgi:hypothetical protein
MITSANQCGHMIFRAPWNAENEWLRQALNNRKNRIHLLSLITGVNISKWPTGFLTLAGAFWVSFVAIGFLILAEEQFTPVKVMPRVALFPPNCGFQLVSDKPTLVLFAHPHCPCTLASLHELAVLIAQTKNRVSAIVVFTIPDGVPAGWEQGDLWDSAKTIPGLHVIRDPGAGKLCVLMLRVRDMSCCMLLPGSCFSAEGSQHPVDTKATTWVVLPS